MNPGILIDRLVENGGDTLFHSGETDLILEALKRGLEVVDITPVRGLGGYLKEIGSGASFGSGTGMGSGGASTSHTWDPSDEGFYFEDFSRHEEYRERGYNRFTKLFRNPVEFHFRMLVRSRFEDVWWPYESFDFYR